jgi:hypothetical protein
MGGCVVLMADDVYTPGQSGTKKPGMKKSTKTWLLIGGLAVGGVVVWYVVKSRSGSSSTNAAATDPSVDPSTGIPYAEEYAQGAMGTTPSLYGYTDPSTGQYITGVGATTVTQPSTNASWAQEVESYLENLGYDPTTTAAAIGKYLTGQPLTSDQNSVVAAALGFFGNPPTGAPPTIVSTPTGNGTGGGSTGGTGTKPPATIKAPGGLTIAQIAAELGLRWKNLQKLNPNLKKYFGKAVPKGTTVKVH